jgi:tetratricopeptide (TPR) repeat protein
MMDAYLPELVQANAYGQKGRVEKARKLYETMLSRVPVQAGLRYNLALAEAKAGEWEESLEVAQASLRDCSNYTPAGTLVSQALVALNRAEESDQFLKKWGVPEGTALKSPGDSEHIQRRASNDKAEGFRDSKER